MRAVKVTTSGMQVLGLASVPAGSVLAVRPADAAVDAPVDAHVDGHVDASARRVSGEVLPARSAIRMFAGAA